MNNAFLKESLLKEVDATKQVEFIAYLQRLLVEGDFVATYKFALLHALADICIEKAHYTRPNAGPNTGSNISHEADCIITIDEIVEKFIELYWQHSLPFSATDAEPFLLLQNSGKQSALINNLSVFRSQGVRNLSQLKAHSGWRKLCSETRKTLNKGPLWRLQLLAGNPECFYYPHDKSKKYIQLNSGIAFCFRRFHDLVVSLARSHWTQKVCDFASNQNVIGGQGNLSDFLFGSDRKAITQARPLLLQIQHGNCFYCQQPLKEQGEVDHFIPWARYPSDLGHNFVLAHSKCNNAKRDHLAAEKHKDRWFEQNIIKYSTDITDELQHHFTCDKQRSEAIATWAYQLADQNCSPLWLKGKKFDSFNLEKLLTVQLAAHIVHDQ